MRTKLGLIVAAATMVASCAADAPTGPPFRTDATVQMLMANMVDPAADLVAYLVSTGDGGWSPAEGAISELTGQQHEQLDHLALGDVDRPVKSHVFEKMRDALLGIGLVERTGGDAHADRRIAARGLILHHRVAQTVG